MGMFQQHKAGSVNIITDDGTMYSDTWENFVVDFGQPLPELPEGMVERIYSQGRRHCFQSLENVAEAGPISGYEYGDTAIAMTQELIQKQNVRKLQKAVEDQAEFQAHVAEANAMIARGEKYTGRIMKR